MEVLLGTSRYKHKELGGLCLQFCLIFSRKWKWKVSFEERKMQT